MAEENRVALPRTVAWLGYGGLLPFLVLTPATLLDHHHGAVWSDAYLPSKAELNVLPPAKK